jgi:M3 family oligoendopeptidase
MLAENAKKVFNSSIIELAQAENQLSTDYNNLIASAQIPFNGETLTLPQIGKYASDKDQAIRKAAQDARNTWFEENEAAFDDIYDKMVKNRDDQARLLGYPDYVAMSYDRMNRFGYEREDVARYRKQILDEVVPVAQKYYERQARRNGHDDGKMAYYDLPLEFASGNATPHGTTSEKLATAQKMYHELSPETGSFFDFMVDSDLFDLDSKKGKQSGGYCEFLPEYKAPFIFANYNGTSGDVDVLTHEAGHAFQVYQSRHIEDPDIVWPTIEAAEIFSMSMEFITWPWMENFFGDQVTKYKYSHLLSALEFLPYGVLVDHFQHEVYSHVDWTPAERKACWRELEKLYKPEQDYSESAFLDRGTYWYRQGHIFDVPFYYIDYTLAQVVAFQFWKRFEIDGDREQAWQDYMAVAKTGGERTFLEIVETAGLKSPFAEGALHESIQAIDDFLSGISEEELA